MTMPRNEAARRPAVGYVVEYLDPRKGWLIAQRCESHEAGALWMQRNPSAYRRRLRRA